MQSDTHLYPDTLPTAQTNLVCTKYGSRNRLRPKSSPGHFRMAVLRGVCGCELSTKILYTGLNTIIYQFNENSKILETCLVLIRQAITCTDLENSMGVGPDNFFFSVITIISGRVVQTYLKKQLDPMSFWRGCFPEFF